MWPFNKIKDAFSFGGENATQKVEADQVRQASNREIDAGLDPSEISIINRVRELEKVFTDIDKGIDEITGNDYRIITITDWLNAMRSADVPWR